MLLLLSYIVVVLFLLCLFCSPHLCVGFLFFALHPPPPSPPPSSVVSNLSHSHYYSHSHSSLSTSHTHHHITLISHSHHCGGWAEGERVVAALGPRPRCYCDLHSFPLVLLVALRLPLTVSMAFSAHSSLLPLTPVSSPYVLQFRCGVVRSYYF